MTSEPPRPLVAVRRFCLACCNGAAREVDLCTAKACSLWPFRAGRRPSENVRVELGARKMRPLETNMEAVAFFAKRGTPLKAIKYKCLDCSGNGKSEVTHCAHVSCELYRYRKGANPNRALRPEQREFAAARLRANVERAKNAAQEDGRNSSTHVEKDGADESPTSVQSGSADAIKTDDVSRRLVGKK